MTKIDNHNGERRRQGRIEVICGSMFSGKTEELIRRMKRAKFAKQRVEIFKPSIDTRYSDMTRTASILHLSTHLVTFFFLPQTLMSWALTRRNS